MKITCEDLFFARARNPSTATSNGSGALDVAPLESASGLDAKLSVLDELIDVNVLTPSSVRFSPDVSYKFMTSYALHLTDVELYNSK